MPCSLDSFLSNKTCGKNVGFNIWSVIIDKKKKKITMYLYIRVYLR